MAKRTARRSELERGAHLAMARAVGVMEREFAELFKAHGISVAQFNVLRILRGVGPDGAACGEIGSRLIRHDPDVTRLLDRLDEAGLIARTRDDVDRRVVRTRITALGLALLDRLDGPVEELHARQLGHMSLESLEALRSLADEAQTKP